MPLVEISPPDMPPVSLAQIKQHLRIDHNEDDEYLSGLADAARLHIEAVSGHFLITRTVRQYVEELPNSRSVVLNAWPIQAIEKIMGYDLDGNPKTLTLDQYKLDNRFDPATLSFSQTLSFGSFKNGIEVDFVAGYGETGLDVPSNIIRAVLVLVAHWYEFRGTMPAGDETALIPEGLNKLLAPIKRARL